MISRPWLALWFVLGCTRALRPAPTVDIVATPLEQARARPIPTALQGRFSFTLKAPGTAVSTGGVVILDRPGRGHLAVLGPLGGPLATLQTDGAGAAVAIARDRQHLVALDAEQAIRELTRGLVGIDELLGLWVGDLPLDGEGVEDQGDRAVLGGPEGTSLSAVLDPTTGTPVSAVVADAAGQPMLEVRYAPFSPFGEEGALLPTELAIELPRLGTRLEVRIKSWTVPDPMPEVFGLSAPEGFRSSPLEDSARSWALLFAPGAAGSTAGEGG